MALVSFEETLTCAHPERHMAARMGHLRTVWQPGAAGWLSLRLLWLLSPPPELAARRWRRALHQPCRC